MSLFLVAAYGGNIKEIGARLSLMFQHSVAMLLLLVVIFWCSALTTAPLQASIQRTDSSLNFHLTFNNTHSIQLHLTNNQQQQQTQQPTLVEGSKIRSSRGERYKTTSYSDPSHNALFTLESSNDPAHPDPLYYGSFTYNTSFFNLEASSALDAQPGSVHKQVYSLEIAGKAYKLYEEKQMEERNQEDAVVELQSDKETNFMVNWLSSKMQDKITGGGGNVYVEFVIVLDVSVYDKWRKFTGNRDKAIHNIKYYYTHIANGVKANYGLISDPGYKVSLHFTGIYIAETKSDDPYSLDTSTLEGQYLNAYRGLDQWIEFVEKKKSSPGFPAYDVATAFTDYNMVSMNGLAYVKKACHSNGVSINKDNGPYQSINTATHEIGHNLGASHDANDNDCKYEDQYVMASGRAKMTVNNFQNQFIFSSCSLNYFKKYIDILKGEGQDCLHNLPTTTPATTTKEFLSQHPGQAFDIHQQCEMLTGKGNRACGGMKGDKNFCMQIVCYQDNYKICKTTLNIAPAIGTSCGDGKWCVAGKCVADVNAPSYRDSCLTGDFQEGIVTHEGTFLCPNLISMKPWNCYSKYYHDLCCHSCLRLNETFTDPSCPYGDKIEGCRVKDCVHSSVDCCGTCEGVDVTKLQEEDRKTVIAPENKCKDGAGCKKYQARHCYEDNVLKDCCETCQKFKKPDAHDDCTYGDRDWWCKDRVAENPEECSKSPDIKERCCHSCLGVKQKATRDGGCVDTDDCSDVSDRHCYDAEVEKNCCQRCLIFRKDRTGTCRYGSRYSFCKRKHCKDEVFRELCCEICH